MVPLISSICQGALGVCQLPRFWWKTITRSIGSLDPDYPDCSGGLDTRCMEVLGLPRDETLSYLRKELPTYLEFEAWVSQRTGETLNTAAINRWNDAVNHRVHTKPAKIAETYGDIGWPLDQRHTDAVLLNSLQDWQLFHRRDLMAGTPDLRAPVIPLISSIDRGTLGICQLPRTWLKISLHSKGLLHADYPACGPGLDQRVLDLLHLDRSEVVSTLSGNRPTYLEFEDWVAARGSIDDEAVAAWNVFIRDRVHADEKRSDIHATLDRKDDGTLQSAVLLNHLEDWHLARRSLTA